MVSTRARFSSKLFPMSVVVFGALAVLAVVGFAFALRNATELLRIRVRAGRVEFLRGRLPTKLRHEIQDIFDRTVVGEGMVYVRLEGQVPRVHAEGLPDGTVQQLRNVVGQFSVAQLRQAPPVSGR